MEKNQQLEDLYLEGWMDRQKARLAGLTSGAKAIGGNIKNVFTGGTSVDPKEAARQSKLDSIINTFKSDMAKLFPEWNIDISTNRTTTPIAPATSAPYPAVDETTPVTPQHPESISSPDVDMDKGMTEKPTPRGPTKVQQTINKRLEGKSKRLNQFAVVTGKGRYDGQKFKVVKDKNERVVVQPVKRQRKQNHFVFIPVGTPKTVLRSDLIESNKMKFEDAYKALNEVEEF